MKQTLTQPERPAHGKARSLNSESRSSEDLCWSRSSSDPLQGGDNSCGIAGLPTLGDCDIILHVCETCLRANVSAYVRTCVRECVRGGSWETRETSIVYELLCLYVYLFMCPWMSSPLFVCTCICPRLLLLHSVFMPLTWHNTSSLLCVYLPLPAATLPPFLTPEEVKGHQKYPRHDRPNRSCTSSTPTMHQALRSNLLTVHEFLFKQCRCCHRRSHLRWEVWQ